jgi:hypothetical protein
MPENSPLVPDPPETRDVTVETHPLAIFERGTPAMIDPETLLLGLRYLQQRIPDFQVLSVAEERKMMRAAHLDPQFIAIGVQTAEVWNEPRALIGATGEELRQDAAEQGPWDEVERECRVLIKGIAGARLKRRYRIGNAVLRLYDVLRRGQRPDLQIHLDEMKRAYNRKRSKARKASPPEDPKE